jgi:nucleoside-diphosphate-sugar epimerase
MTEMAERFRGRRILVTGGAGFIGSHLCEALVECGGEVTSVDDYSAGKPQNHACVEGTRGFRAVKADVCDRSAMEELISGIDYIFHNAASKKNVCLKDPARDLAVNAGGTLNLLELAIKHRVKKFVHASTGSVYGEPSQFPTDEDHPLRPVSYYGVSKLAGERYVDVFHHLYGLDTTILRYFHVYGPRQESNEFGGVVSIFLRNALEGRPLTIFGDGSQLRSFTWVKDLVRANLLAAISERATGKVYNCASGIQVSVRELAEGILGLSGVPAGSGIEYGEWLPGDIKFFDVSNASIKADLGLDFERDFWGKMRETVEDFILYLRTYALTETV